MPNIEIDFITFRSVEYAHKRAIQEQANCNEAFAEIGMRCAINRDPKLLLALEKATECLIQQEHNQRAHSMLTADNENERRYTTETQMWREAYRMVDEGKAVQVPHLKWIYAAGAFLCGYQL